MLSIHAPISVWVSANLQLYPWHLQSYTPDSPNLSTTPAISPTSHINGTETDLQASHRQGVSVDHLAGQGPNPVIAAQDSQAGHLRHQLLIAAGVVPVTSYGGIKHPPSTQILIAAGVVPVTSYGGIKLILRWDGPTCI